MGGADFPAAGTTTPESGQPDHPQFIVKATASTPHLRKINFSKNFSIYALRNISNEETAVCGDAPVFIGRGSPKTPAQQILRSRALCLSNPRLLTSHLRLADADAMVNF
jgi:hypothetical protein